MEAGLLKMMDAMFLYNAGVSVYEAGISIAGIWNAKAALWRKGRRGLLKTITQSIKAEDEIFWLHAASVGEFEQGRPLLEYVREHCPQYKILLTFYSPSGYQLRKNYNGADYVFYFPSDRPSVAKSFIEAIHPKIAVFVKYEFWLNTLAELRRRNVKTFIISSIFRKNSVFFKPYGRPWRRALATFDTIFVQDEHSRVLLDGIGISNVVVAGDTRFDRVVKIAGTASGLETISRFCGGAQVFVAGSTWGPDEKLLIRLANEHPALKFIIVPHEIDNSRIASIENQVNGGAVRYSLAAENLETMQLHCEAASAGDRVSSGEAVSSGESETVAAVGKMMDRQVMIVDKVGILSRIYRYASFVYVGGGFGAGIHNTIEAASYGIPLSFGPSYHKFKEAVEMVGLGTATSVQDYDDLAKWLDTLLNDEQLRLSICRTAKEYTQRNVGATDLIAESMHLR